MDTLIDDLAEGLGISVLGMDTPLLPKWWSTLKIDLSKNAARKTRHADFR